MTMTAEKAPFQAASRRPVAPLRTPRPQRLLMTRPTYFDVVYSINAWMDTAVPTDSSKAMQQWENLVVTFRRLGHTVEICEGVPGLPDMVFAANAGTVVDGVAVPAKFATDKRAGEQAPYTEWFSAHVGSVVEPTLVNEGEGDMLWTGRLLLAGSGFRTDPLAHNEVAEALGVPLVPLKLVDPHFYHLDTALAVLAGDPGTPETIAYYPGAFSVGSQRALARLYPDAIIASRADAEWFALNAVSDGRNVVVPEQAPTFARQLTERGFTPVPVDVSEFRKAGGGAKCCTLILRG
jgi:N-dimethylarginine dimethylaminohydrolase